VIHRLVVQTLASPADRIDPRVDLVELRLDLYPDCDAAAFCARCEKPVIATARGMPELLANASGARYVDLDLNDPDVAIPEGAGIVRSFHDWEGVPDDCDAIVESMFLRGGDLFKFVATPQSAADALRLLDLPVSAFGMGPYGTFTRALAPLTYCGNTAIAPGMPTPADLFDGYGIDRLSLAPTWYGVAGNPIDHSASPAIHNPAFRRDGIDAIYLRFLVDDLAAFWPEFVARGGRGLSVTAPLKLQAAQLAREPDADVRACGAANTLLADGRAANTDVQAFLELVPAGTGNALVMGAGGSARAAVCALRRLGYRVRVWARRPEAAAELGDVAATLEPADVVVNTTPVLPPPAPFLLDLIYAADSGPAQIDGMTFLRAQARHQYRLFTGGELA